MLARLLLGSLAACALFACAEKETYDTAGTSSAVSASSWRPTPGTSWQWQLSGTIDTSVNAAVYDIDLFTTPQGTIEGLHAQGRRVVCYFSAGSYEPDRPDSAQIPAAAKGEVMDGWPDEKWLDIRNAQVKTIMQQRIALAAQKHCDGVEPDNVDGYANETGFDLSEDDQLAFDKFLAAQAHANSLVVTLKNDLDQIPSLVNDFDFALNEQCWEYDECDGLEAFINQNKAVFNVEYGNASLASSVCPKANAMNFDTLIKNLDLDASRIACR